MKASVVEIIGCLDRRLEITKPPFLTAGDANKILARAKLLRDSRSRPGAPLRALLREGLLRHAYKDGSDWVIPHSGVHKARNSRRVRRR